MSSPRRVMSGAGIRSKASCGSLLLTVAPNDLQTFTVLRRSSSVIGCCGDAWKP